MHWLNLSQQVPKTEVDWSRGRKKSPFFALTLYDTILPSAPMHLTPPPIAHFLKFVYQFLLRFLTSTFLQANYDTDTDVKLSRVGVKGKHTRKNGFYSRIWVHGRRNDLQAWLFLWWRNWVILMEAKAQSQGESGSLVDLATGTLHWPYTKANS